MDKSTNLQNTDFSQINKSYNNGEKPENKLKKGIKSKRNWLIGGLIALGIWSHGDQITKEIPQKAQEVYFEQVTQNPKFRAIKKQTHYIENPKMYDELFTGIENIENLNQIGQIQVMFSRIISDVSKIKNTKYRNDIEQQRLLDEYMANLNNFEKDVTKFLIKKLSKNEK